MDFVNKFANKDKFGLFEKKHVRRAKNYIVYFFIFYLNSKKIIFKKKILSKLHRVM